MGKRASNSRPQHFTLRSDTELSKAVRLVSQRVCHCVIVWKFLSAERDRCWVCQKQEIRACPLFRRIHLWPRIIAISYTNKNTTVLAKRQIRSRLWISQECKQEQMQVNTVKCMCARVINLMHTQKWKLITTVDFIEMQITPTQNSCKSHILIKILTRSLFPPLLSCGIINLLESYLPIFISILTLKVFILPDLGAVTLVHCLAPAEAIRNDKRQKSREKIDKARNTFEVSEHKYFLCVIAFRNS